jgi:ATP synthase protein I
MPQSDDHDPGALQRLDDKLKAFESRRAGPASSANPSGAAAIAYRMMASLIGGLLGGLGLGWFFDQLAHTAPLGLIVGLLIGVGASTYSVVRSAGRMSKTSPTPSGPIAPAPVDDGDD